VTVEQIHSPTTHMAKPGHFYHCTCNVSFKVHDFYFDHLSYFSTYSGLTVCECLSIFQSVKFLLIQVLLMTQIFFKFGCCFMFVMSSYLKKSSNKENILKLNKMPFSP
jgi:hypothetical protein